MQSDSTRVPLAMAIGAFLGAAWAALTALVLPLAAAGGLPLSIAGTDAPARAWMRITAPLAIVTAVLLALFAIGVAARRLWTRPLVPLLGASIAIDRALWGLAGLLPPASAAAGSFEGIVLALVALWYFYRRPRVAAYYRSLRRD